MIINQFPGANKLFITLYHSIKLCIALTTPWFALWRMTAAEKQKAEWGLIGDHVSHASVESARHCTHDAIVPADMKIRRPSFALRLVQVATQFRLEVVVVRRTIQSALSFQHVGVSVQVARHEFSQSVRKVSRWPEVADVDVDAWRHEARVISSSEDHGDDVQLQGAPELLGDVVDAQTVLKRQIEEVASLEHLETVFDRTRRTFERSAAAVHIHVDETSQLRHVTVRATFDQWCNTILV